MTYDEARDAAQLSELDVAITAFIEKCKKHPDPTGRQRTLILFPGGCGSRLKQSPEVFDGKKGTDPSAYRDVWLNCYTLFGGALELEMVQLDGKWIEKNNRIVIASGSVQLFGYTPYDEFARWASHRGIQVFFYGYDWRRAIPEMGVFFKEQFLPLFQKRVKAECGFDPLANLDLVGHCLGGMLLNWIIRTYDKDLSGMGRAVTVATPFYGYAGQIGRWFAGEPVLNVMGGEDAMVKVISSFAGLYAVNLMSERTYDDNAQAFAADPYPLAAYPSLDAAPPYGRVDPYQPEERAPDYRYPAESVTGFSRGELSKAKDIAAFLSSPMDPALSIRFFNIRGIYLKDGNTAATTSWKTIGKDFDPDKEGDPIRITSTLPGDDTQPAWTARLLRSDPHEQTDNVITVKAVDAEHVFMMVSGAVLKKLALVLGVPVKVAGEVKRKPGMPEVAPRRVALAFVEALNKRFGAYHDHPFEVTAQQLDLFLQQGGWGKALLLSIGRRILIELVKPLPNEPRTTTGGKT